MKIVAKFLNSEEAKIARGYLAANGIAAILAGEESLSVMPHISMGGANHALMVEDDDFEQAKALLNSVEEGHKERTVKENNFVTNKNTLATLFFAFIVISFVFSNQDHTLNRHALGLNGFHTFISCFIW